MDTESVAHLTCHVTDCNAKPKARKLYHLAILQAERSLFMYKNFKLFDRYDYQRLELKERWCLIDAAKLLVCFYMQTNGLCYQEDSPEQQLKLLHNCLSLLADSIYHDEITYLNNFSLDEENDHHVENVSHGYDHGSFYVRSNSTSVSKSELLNHIETNKIMKLDVSRLKRYLSWDEYPEASKEHPGLCNPIGELEVHHVFRFPAKTEAVSQHTSKHKYCFMKIGNGWNLRFEDAVLNGVKDTFGMNYIKTLLESPGHKVSVYTLQGLATPSTYLTVDEGDENKNMLGDSEMQDSDETEFEVEHNKCDLKARCVSAWEKLDVTAINNYKERLQEIEAKIAAEYNSSSRNKTRIKRLEDEQQAIEVQLSEASYRSKDPDLEKNRKRVSKNISDTLKIIIKLEARSGYYDKPISKHLNRYIRKGSNCSYMAEGENLPAWKF